jgi:pimeloyl-ACP methyl ester carboxylesterase
VSSALVIVDITHRTNPVGIEKIKNFMMSGLGGFATLEEAASAIAAYTPNRKRSTNPDGLRKVLRQKADGRWHWHWDPAFMSRKGVEVPSPDFEDVFGLALGRIRVPTLLVRGKLSDVVTDDGVRDFLARIPGSRLADVSDAAHMVAGDQNDVFSSAVIRFLEEDVRPRLARR